jgi:hypothetical protein
MPAAALIEMSIFTAFQDTKNHVGPCITKMVMKKTPGGLPVMIPTTGTKALDPLLAKAIAGAVADGIAKFLP